MTTDKTALDPIQHQLDGLIKDNKERNNKFDTYQNRIQWLVQLAFSLIASATITVIITSVLRK